MERRLSWEELWGKTQPADARIAMTKIAPGDMLRWNTERFDGFAMVVGHTEILSNGESEPGVLILFAGGRSIQEYSMGHFNVRSIGLFLKMMK